MIEKEILSALDAVDEKYLEDAKPMRKKAGLTKIAVIAASLALAVGLSIWLMLGNGTDNTVIPGTDNTVIPDNLYSEYYAGENYSRLTAVLEDFEGKNSTRQILQENFTSGFSDTPEYEDGSASDVNGSYISVTENQVDGVDEPDIFKMTDKYIFRIGGVKNGGEALRIYTIDGDNSKQVGEFNIPCFDFSEYSVGAEMFLSNDGNTVTIIKSSYVNDNYYIYKTVLMLVDVSDVTSPKLTKSIAINGEYDFIRNIGGALVLGTDFLSAKYSYDWADPNEYLPYYEANEVKTYLAPEDIICPNEIYKRAYSSFFLLDENLTVISSKAVFGVSGLSYVSEDKIVSSIGYADTTENVGDLGCKTDFAVIDFSSGKLKIQSMLTADGWVSDRFCIDEKDGYLRVVTNDYYILDKYSLGSKSSSLYIFEFDDCSLVASVKDFAPDGENATSVRFDGDKLYVCTAEIKTFTDPVYFFDLSDYSNISQVNTGFIDGFSTALINYNDKFLIGIGVKDSEVNKVSVYKREGNSVVTVDEYYFKGVHSDDRKAFIIDKEKGIFGFASHSYYEYDEEGNRYFVNGAYHLLRFDGESLTEIHTVKDFNHNVQTVRAVYYEGYLYITKNMEIVVEKVD